ncbi:hypothetical protein DEO72_LG7g2862 [Vigna unguiculata]|uniref:Uncharacterized protein n=1 Tax=Vigna unguiculata TaxID=3917 RepID=A0A4D6MLA3_VIGUN|nr:hypothetical protein DEO72_LG7g2862 [Vigna unguiculata]
MNKITPAQLAKPRTRHSLADHENFAHLLPSTTLMIIARRTAPYKQTGKLEPTHIHHTVKSIIIIPCPYNNQACYDSSFNTLRLDSTHPDTYNLVGLSGCLHLWWIPLLHPELLISELCVTSVTMNQISVTTRLRSLAQARVSRSGESSPPRREFANLEQGPPHATICARRPGRASARLAWASLTVIATAMPATVETYTNQQQHQPFQAISTTYKFKNHKVYLKKVHKHNNNEVLASRTWKWVRAGLDTGPQSTAVRETDRELAEQWNNQDDKANPSRALVRKGKVTTAEFLQE